MDLFSNINISDELSETISDNITKLLDRKQNEMNECVVYLYKNFIYKYDLSIDEINKCTQIYNKIIHIYKTYNIKYIIADDKMYDIATLLYYLKHYNINEITFNWIDTCKLTSLNFLFKNCFDIIDLDISEWDVSNVKNMSQMFYNSDFNGDISKWDVSNLQLAPYMFYNSDFNRDISKWDLTLDKESQDMFGNCPIPEKFKPKIKFNI